MTRDVAFKKLPPNWQLARLRHVAAINPLPDNAALQDDAEVSFLPMEAIGENGSLSLERVRPVGEVRAGYSYFADGDVAFAKVTPCFENGKGALMRDLTGGVGFGTTELTVLRPGPELDARFLHYFITSPTFRGPGAGAMTGAGGLKRVPEEFTRNMRLPLPPLPVQRQIAKALDRETARIDALIAKKTRFIELLREKRQALITQAVTQGLDPAVPMKDSRVEWLGQVPVHWRVSPLKYIAQVQTGVAKGKDTAGRKTIEVPYLRVANVQDGYLDLNEIATIEIDADDLPRYLLQAGDVLMNEGGDFDKLGRGHVWQGEIELCIHQNHVFAVRPTHISSDWLNAYTSSLAAQFYFMSRSKQSTNLASISSTNLMELPVPIPPASEQAEVLARVKDGTARMEALTRTTERSLALLKERRSALITAAVTGQIDLREAA